MTKRIITLKTDRKWTCNILPCRELNYLNFVSKSFFLIGLKFEAKMEDFEILSCNRAPCHCKCSSIRKDLFSHVGSTNFFNCSLAVPQSVFGHSRRDSLTNPILITALVQFRPESHRKFFNSNFIALTH